MYGLVYDVETIDRHLELFLTYEKNQGNVKVFPGQYPYFRKKINIL